MALARTTVCCDPDSFQWGEDLLPQQKIGGSILHTHTHTHPAYPPAGGSPQGGLYLGFLPNLRDRDTGNSFSLEFGGKTGFHSELTRFSLSLCV